MDLIINPQTYNITFSIAALILILVTLAIHSVEESYFSRQKQAFGAVLFDGLVMNVLGLTHNLWLYTEPVREVITPEMNNFIVLFQKICTYLLAYLSLVYFMSIFRIEADTLIKKFLLSLPMLYSVMFFLNYLWNDFFFTFDANGEVAYNYPQGATVNISLYVYFILAAYLYFKYGKTLSTEKKISVILYYLLMLAGIPIRILTRSSSIFEFSASIALLLCVYTFQNPSEFSDRVSGAGTKNALSFAISSNLLQKKNFTLFGICIERLDVILGGVSIEVMGDMLTQISSYLKQFCTEGNIFYSDDGSFMMIFMDSEPDDPNIEKTADLIKKRFREPWMLDGKPIRLFESPYAIGFPDEVDSLDKYNEVKPVIRKALSRHNREVLRLTDLNLKHVEHDKKIDGIVKRALEDGLLEVYYQPIYNPKAGKFTSCEALLRLRDPQLGFISPAVFMPVAELNGTVIDIDAFVLDSVCSMVEASEATGLGIEYVEVNLSVVDCIQTNLAENVIKTLEKHHVRPDQINLEITETYEQGITSIMEENVRKLREYGISFSMDDFGTGYSNLTRISTLPVSIFKLDKSIIQEAFESETSYMVMLNMVKIIKSLEKEIVAEGVETAEQARQIIRVGCDYIQGFFYARPMPKAQFLDFLKEHNTP